jgi:hypothetical protein
MSDLIGIARFRFHEGKRDEYLRLSDPVFATVSLIHGELPGDASAELRANLAGSDAPALFTPYRSLSRGR